MEIDVAAAINASKNAAPFIISGVSLAHTDEEQLEEVLVVFLKEIGKDDLIIPLAYCLREIATNAVKANTKRVFFAEKNLDLNSGDSYELGMRSFRQETMSNINHYLEKQGDSGLYFKIIFHIDAGFFNITVRNNVPMTRQEHQRVTERIERARKIASIEEAMQIVDESEGSGLGLIILILTLKKIGLDKDAFSITVENDETVAKVSIPTASINDQLISIADHLLQFIDSVPQFPDNLAKLRSLLSQPDAEVKSIARLVASDPGLSTEVLKLANSPLYLSASQVKTIAGAVMRIGLRGLHNIVIALGVQKLLPGTSEQIRTIWHQAYRSAYYAFLLAQRLVKDREILDDVYLGGLLHEIGKIVLFKLHPETTTAIQKFCQDKQIGSELLEELLAGVHHAEIGAILAQRWNFPTSLVEAIRFHHTPLVPETHQPNPTVTIVYLAACMTACECGEMTWDQINQDILQLYDIASIAHFKDLQTSIRAVFESKNA